ncbi:MAG: MarR family winged helix-turn-helix transcriptional regulator, partial [Eubacteriales bacterium]
IYTLIHCAGPDCRGIKISDLSTQLQITPAGVTHMINSLEEGGYVERLADSADRRVVLVKPTAKGKQVIESMKVEHLEKLKGLVGSLGEQDSKELIRLLSSTLTYLKERRDHNADKVQT